MKVGKIVAGAMIAVSLLIIEPSSAGIRCGRDIITIGDHSFTVLTKLQDCGNILGRMTIGYEADRRGSEKLVEHWLIKVGQYCYILKFSGGELIEIGNWQKCGKY